MICWLLSDAHFAEHNILCTNLLCFSDCISCVLHKACMKHQIMYVSENKDVMWSDLFGKVVKVGRQSLSSLDIVRNIDLLVSRMGTIVSAAHRKQNNRSVEVILEA